MSVINKVPLINTILSGLSKEQLQSLRDLVNGDYTKSDVIFRTCKPLGENKLTAADKGIKPIQIEIKNPVAAQQIYEGYLIYTDDGCWVISFANDGAQCLLILTIDENLNVEIESACCSVLELRSELDDQLTADGGDIVVTANDIDSGSATEGQALVADGNGGAIWGEAAGGGGDFEELDVRNENGTTLLEVYEAIIALHPEGTNNGPLYFKIKYNDLNMSNREMEGIICISGISVGGPSVEQTYLSFECFFGKNGWTYNDLLSNASNVRFLSGLKQQILVPLFSPTSDGGKVLTAVAYSSVPSWQTPAGGTQLYKHEIVCNTYPQSEPNVYSILLISEDSTPLSAPVTVVDVMKEIIHGGRSVSKGPVSLSWLYSSFNYENSSSNKQFLFGSASGASTTIVACPIDFANKTILDAITLTFDALVDTVTAL